MPSTVQLYSTRKRDMPYLTADSFSNPPPLMDTVYRLVLIMQTHFFSVLCVAKLPQEPAMSVQQWLEKVPLCISMQRHYHSRVYSKCCKIAVGRWHNFLVKICWGMKCFCLSSWSYVQRLGKPQDRRKLDCSTVHALQCIMFEVHDGQSYTTLIKQTA